jgi:hypothetical protein
VSRTPWPIATAWPLLSMFDTGNDGHIGWVVAVSDALADGWDGRRAILARVAAWDRGAPIRWDYWNGR